MLESVELCSEVSLLKQSSMRVATEFPPNDLFLVDLVITTMTWQCLIRVCGQFHDVTQWNMASLVNNLCPAEVEAKPRVCLSRWNDQRHTTSNDLLEFIFPFSPANQPFWIPINYLLLQFSLAVCCDWSLTESIQWVFSVLCITLCVSVIVNSADCDC